MGFLGHIHAALRIHGARCRHIRGRPPDKQLARAVLAVIGILRRDVPEVVLGDNNVLCGQLRACNPDFACRNLVSHGHLAAACDAEGAMCADVGGHLQHRLTFHVDVAVAPGGGEAIFVSGVMVVEVREAQVDIIGVTLAGRDGVGNELTRAPIRCQRDNRVIARVVHVFLRDTRGVVVVAPVIHGTQHAVGAAKGQVLVTSRTIFVPHEPRFRFAVGVVGDILHGIGGGGNGDGGEKGCKKSLSQ